MFGIIKCSISRVFRGLCLLVHTRALPWTFWKALSAPRAPTVQCNDLLSLHVLPSVLLQTKLTGVYISIILSWGIKILKKIHWAMKIFQLKKSVPPPSRLYLMTAPLPAFLYKCDTMNLLK